MTEMGNQIKVGGVYHSQMHSISSDANYLNFFLKYGHFEREREKYENCKRPSLSTNNEAEFSYLKYSNFTRQEVYELLNVISDLCVRVVCVN